MDGRAAVDVSWRAVMTSLAAHRLHSREDGSELAIEFGGRYEAERVQDLHVDCAKRGRPYELW